MPHSVSCAEWLRGRWKLLGYKHDSLSRASGLSLRTIERIEAGYAPSRATVYCLSYLLGYGPDVADMLCGEVRHDYRTLDALAAPADAITRHSFMPAEYRDRSIFVRRVGRGLPPYVSPRSWVVCAAGPVKDGALALVEFTRRRTQAVRFVWNMGETWQLAENRQGAGWHEIPAARVARVSTVIYEVKRVGQAVLLWLAADVALVAFMAMRG